MALINASHAHQQSEGFKEIRMRGIAAAGWLFFVGLIGTARGQLDVHALSGCSETGKNQPTMKFVAVEAGGPSHFLYGASFTRLTEITSTNIAWSQLTEGGIPYWKNSKTNETTLVLMEYTNVDEGHLGFYIFGGDGGNAANETNIDSLKSGLWNLAYEDERGWHWDKFMIYTEVPARRRSGTSNVINGERSMIIFGGEYARPSCETLIGKAISPSTFQLLASNSATTAAGCRSACKANTTCTSWQLKSGSCQLSLFAGTVLYVDFIGASSGEMCTPANSMQYLNDMWHFDFTLEEYTNIYALTSTADGVFPDGAPILAEDRPAGRAAFGNIIDALDDELVIYGGYGYGSDGLGSYVPSYLNDVYTYNFTTTVWVRKAGNEVGNVLANYDAAKGTVSPGGRAYFGFSAGPVLNGDEPTFMVFGGHSAAGVHNDMWQLNLEAGTWAFVAGETTPNQTPVYDSDFPAGTNSPLNRPAATSEPTLASYEGMMYVFGGVMATGETSKDLWRFDISVGQFAWLAQADSRINSGLWGNHMSAYDNALWIVTDPQNLPGNEYGVFRICIESQWQLNTLPLTANFTSVSPTAAPTVPILLLEGDMMGSSCDSDIVILLDGSFTVNWTQAKNFTHRLVDRLLREGNRVAVLQIGTTVELELQLTADRMLAAEAIRDMVHLANNRDIEAGLRRALSIISNTYGKPENAKNPVVVLVSEGGHLSGNAPASQAMVLGEAGLPVVVVGMLPKLGTDLDRRELQVVANLSNTNKFVPAVLEFDSYMDAQTEAGTHSIAQTVCALGYFLCDAASPFYLESLAGRLLQDNRGIVGLGVSEDATRGFMKWTFQRHSTEDGGLYIQSYRRYNLEDEVGMVALQNSLVDDGDKSNEVWRFEVTGPGLVSIKGSTGGYLADNGGVLGLNTLPQSWSVRQVTTGDASTPCLADASLFAVVTSTPSRAPTRSPTRSPTTSPTVSDAPAKLEFGPENCTCDVPLRAYQPVEENYNFWIALLIPTLLALFFAILWVRQRSRKESIVHPQDKDNSYSALAVDVQLKEPPMPLLAAGELAINGQISVQPAQNTLDEYHVVAFSIELSALQYASNRSALDPYWRDVVATRIAPIISEMGPFGVLLRITAHLSELPDGTVAPRYGGDPNATFNFLGPDDEPCVGPATELARLRALGVYQMLHASGIPDAAMKCVGASYVTGSRQTVVIDVLRPRLSEDDIGGPAKDAEEKSSSRTMFEVVIDEQAGYRLKLPVTVHTIERIFTKVIKAKKEKPEKEFTLEVTEPKIVIKEMPVDRIVEKIVIKEVIKEVPVDRIVEKIVEVKVPVDRIVEKIVDRPIMVDKPFVVEKIVEKVVDRPVDRIVDRVVERIVEKPVYVPKIVEVEKIVEKFVKGDTEIVYRDKPEYRELVARLKEKLYRLEMEKKIRGNITANAQKTFAYVPAYLGCRFVDGNNGTKLGAVEGPMALAGCEVHDLILSIDGHATPNRQAFKQQVTRYLPGDELKFLVDRQGQQSEHLVTVGSRDYALEEIRTIRRRMLGAITQAEVDNVYHLMNDDPRRTLRIEDNGASPSRPTQNLKWDAQ